jgi:sugar O-acyltransferase (sialic acid O-acetyltransferase NeuD family)
VKQASTLVILGAGGHGKVVADAALARGHWARVVATDRNPTRCRGELLPGVILVPLEAALALADTDFHVAIGSAEARERETELLAGRALASILHPAATVSPHAVIEAGCFVAAQSVVAPAAALGRGVIVNHGAVVDHDVQVGAFSHIAPRAALGGGVHVGCGVLVGAGTNVLPGLRICAGVTLGAGAVVRATIAEPGVYAGVPARRVR